MDGREELSDGRLLEAARGGDREAFAGLIDRHKNALVGYLAHLTGDFDEAEDLAQESFLRLYERAGRYREQGHFRGYLFRIGINLLRSRRRRQARRELLRAAFLSGNGHRGEAPQQARLLRGELASRLRAELAELPLRMREPLVLYELEGWSYRAIGEHLGCREGTVKSRIHRGRQWLRQRLAPYLAGEER